MAKLKVKQIEDLGIIEVSGENAVTYDAIKIGANTIAPLTTIIEDTSVSGYISGLTQSGNKIVIKRTALPTVPDVEIPEVAGSFVLNAAVNGTNKHQIDLTKGTFDVSTTGESAHTGSLIFDANKLSVNGAWVKGLFSVTPDSGVGYISGLTYANGVFTPTYTALTAAGVPIADGGNLYTAENVETALAEVMTRVNTLDAAQLSAGTGISITDKKINANFTVDTKKYPTESTAEGYVADKAGKTYIRIMDGETLISETDAAVFVKDGFLQSVTKDEGTNELIFTWNSDAGSQVTKIAIKELCDVYTVGDGLVASEGGYKFSHQAGAEGLTANTVFGSGSAEANKITVKVPSVTVDKFGHVSALSETEVSLEIPESVASAVQTVTGDTYVTATKSGTDVTLATKTQAVATAKKAEGETPAVDGLATALDVKTYVDSKVAGATTEATETLEFSKVVKGTRTGEGDVELTPGEGYKIEADSVCVYVNGQLIPDGGYEVTADSNTVKILKPQYGVAGSDFNLDNDDRIDVVAHATKTVTLTYLKLQTAQNA